jgi:hypothetical protein
LAEGERFEIAVKENSLKVCQDPGFYYLEATQGILEIKKLVNKGKSKETVNDEASNNRYTIVENKEEEIEEIANSSDDESILSYTE